MKSKLGEVPSVRAAVRSALVLLPLLAVACGDDAKTSSAGTGSSSGAGGSGGAGAGSTGSAGGSAGTGGNAGTGGSAGSAGSGDRDAETGPQPQIIAISATGHDRFYGVVHDASGNIFATGHVADSTASTADYATVLVKLLPSGAKDASFGSGGVVTYNAAVGAGAELARGIVVQSTGKIVVSAIVEHVGGDPRDRDVAIMRFTQAGALDATFGSGGVRILDLSAGEVTVDGGTVDAGTTIVAESTWGLSGFPNDDLIVLGSRKADGRTDTDFAMVKLKADGSTDTSFAVNGMFTLDINNAGASPRTATVLPDGSVVGSGYMNNGVQMPVIWKLTPAGALDTSFGVNGVFSQPVLAAATEAYGAALQGTSFVTAGYGRANTSESLDFVSIRLTAAGALDKTYGTDGVTRVDAAGFADNSRGLAVLPDNRVMLIGGGRATANDVDGMVAVLTPDGQPDTSFGPQGFRLYDLGGASDFFWGLSVAPDKKSVAIAGIKTGTPGNDAGSAGNDDAALLVLPLVP
ncbi:MAG TPA: hypothetical protein VK550_33520 [Polyangiaceae bacterium]|nr:hypothetical protein [Polyangiaceae bacterium]